MTDFREMLREALLEDEPYREEPGRETIERSVDAFRTRMRSVRLLGLVLVAGPGVLFVAGLYLFFGPGAEDDTTRILGALVGLFGMGCSGMGKMWFHQMVSHVQGMKELKLARLDLAELRERLEALEEEKRDA